MIYFAVSNGFEAIIQGNSSTDFYFSGSIGNLFSQFNNLTLDLVFVLAVVVVIVITTTLITNKKQDIAVMRALGTLPGSLHGYYLLEGVVMFLIGFFLGLICGLLSSGVFYLVVKGLGYSIYFQIDLFYIFLLFTACLVGVIVVPGLLLIRMGKKSIIKSFSRDIPYEYDASKGLTFIPKWLSRISFNLKMSVVNTIRRKGEYQRFLVVFSIIFLIIFTLGLGTAVLSTSSREWIHKSQGDNIVVIGHNDTVYYYSQMYQMFSNPSMHVYEADIDFTMPEYLFNVSEIADLGNYSEIEEMDERLIHFCDISEKSYTVVTQIDPWTYKYTIVGGNRSGTYPIIGVNSSDIIQDFEKSGTIFTDQNSDTYMFVGEGLAFNFFIDVFEQDLSIETVNKTFSISGFVIDSFYCGYAGYVGLEVFQNELNLNAGEINLVLLKIKAGALDDMTDIINETIADNLGSNFTFKLLDGIFEANLNYVFTISQYPMALIVILAVVGIISLYYYQRGGIIEQSKDLLIMRSIGAKKKSIRRMLNFEGLYIIIPSSALSLSMGMIINSLFMLDRSYLPPLHVPLLILSILLIASILFNYLSLIPITKKINDFSINDFDMY